MNRHPSLASHPPHSFRTLLRETLLPKTWYARTGLLLVLMKAVSYWALSIWQHRSEPLSVIAMFRVGDIQYYPLISACAHWQFGESALYERVGEGVTYFPCLTVSVQALCLRLWGAAGLIIADLAVAAGYYVILVVLLRMFGMVKIGAECVGWLIVSGALVPVLDRLREIYHQERIVRLGWIVTWGAFMFVLGSLIVVRRIRSQRKLSDGAARMGLLAMLAILALAPAPIGTPELWGWRIFRPFLSEPIVILGVCCLYRVLTWQAQEFRSLAASGANSPNSRWSARLPNWRWGMAGLVFAVVFQSDIYAAEILAITFFLGVCAAGFMLPGPRHVWDTYLKGAGWFVATASVGSLPFLIQYIFSHPDAARRFGVFAIDRPHILWLPGWGHYAVMAALGLCGLFILHVSRDRLTGTSWLASRNAVGFLLLLCVSALVALPVSGIVLGKGIQLYHFADRFRRVYMYSIIILAGHAVAALPDYFSGNRPSDTYQRRKALGKPLVISLLLVLCLGSSLGQARRLSQKTTHMRSELQDYGVLSHYRADFVGLTTLLHQYRKSGAQVIGTFDHQLYAWWLTFEQGYSFIPDPLLFTGGDQQIERRLGILCHILGMSPAEFHTFFLKPYINHFWLAHNKYKVSQLHTFAPAGDYAADELREIVAQQGILGGAIAVPISEQQRLTRQYAELSAGTVDPFRLDVIVLTKDPFLQQIYPTDEHFVLTYENATFAVWRRRTDVSS